MGIIDDSGMADRLQPTALCLSRKLNNKKQHLELVDRNIMPLEKNSCNLTQVYYHIIQNYKYYVNVTKSTWEMNYAFALTLTQTIIQHMAKSKIPDVIKTIVDSYYPGISMPDDFKPNLKQSHVASFFLIYE